MKITPLLLGVSTVANAALLVTLLRMEPAAATSAAAPTDLVHSKQGATAGARERAAGEEGKSVGATATPGESWAALSEVELPEMVAQLRAAGYPATAIRALVLARLKDRLDARRKELMAGVEEPPYWETGRSGFNPKVQAAQQQLYRERMSVLKELLGPDATEDDEISQYYRRRQFGNISAEKGEELQRVLSDYGELRSEIYQKTNGMILPEDREKITYLERELREDLSRVLTPAELEAYELRSSTTASALRSRLTTFQPTEAEFQALFRAMQTVEAQYGTSQGAMGMEEAKQRREAINQQAKLALSPERYAEFEQATDPRYSTINRIAARYDLPPAVGPAVSAVQQEIRKRAEALRDVKGAERALMLQALAREATARLQPLLGDQALEAYKLYGGQWIQQLAQPPPPPGGAAPVPSAGATRG